jgi:DNA-binding Lrp family transcriptional regulator
VTGTGAGLDRIDLALIEALREDGRLPNKALAQKLGIAEATVASRIRQLREERVMVVALRRDLFSKGYDLQCFADIQVTGRRVEDVARELAAFGSVSSVSLMLGTPEILVVFNAVDRLDLLRVLEQQIAQVEGVARVELHTAVDIRKYKVGYATLSSQSP